MPQSFKNIEFEMRLSPEPFAVTKSGSKTLEVRLEDKRRKQLKTGSLIKFISTINSNDFILARVLQVRRYQSLKDLVVNENIKKTGGLYLNPNDWLEKLKIYYPETNHPCLAIELELL